MSDLLLKYYLRAKAGLNDFFKNEEGDVNVVSIVVLIGIAVLLAIFFKDQIAEVLRSMFSTITGNTSDAVNTQITT